MKRVIIAGATGLVGFELLKLLLEDKNIGEVVALIRTPLDISNNKLLQIKVDFDKIENWENEFYGDAICCCLGSTKKKTPNPADYRKVDHDYPIMLAKIASKRNVAQFHLVSAVGANKNSRIFYNKLKGETEQGLQALFFQSIHIYQPSLIIGNRKEKRSFENIAVHLMKMIDPILIGNLNKYKSIKATDLAKAMINQTFKNLQGVNTYPSHIIKQLA